MSLAVRLRLEAQGEMNEAAAWYERQREGLGNEFLDDVERCLARIGVTPHAAIVWRDDVRRRHVGRFPYHVFYRVTPSEVDVVAIAHEKRRPGSFGTR